MATVEHSTLTSSELHEPKGISSAASGKVYVADGTGSGDWSTMQPSITGWGYYQDNAAEQTFNTTDAKLSIDGTGTETTEAYLPLDIRGSASLWDTTNDKITPTAVGDAYEARINLPITSRTSANYAEVTLDIGGGASPTIVIHTSRIETNRTAPFSHSVVIPISCLSTFVTNGGQVFISTDTGSIGITDPSILLVRTHKEDIA